MQIFADTAAHLPRVVIDTNVVVSAFISPRGAPAKIMEHWERNTFALVVSDPILDEYERALNYDRVRIRHRMTHAEVAAVVEGFRTFAVLVNPRESIRVITADPDDDKFVECAIEGHAAYIVSGDPHLLALGEYRGIYILPPTAFLAILEASERDRMR